MPDTPLPRVIVVQFAEDELALVALLLSANVSMRAGAPHTAFLSVAIADRVLDEMGLGRAKALAKCLMELNMGHAFPDDDTSPNARD